MNDTYDGLQDRLTRLEADEPLESLLAGLPEDEAGLLKMAAMLRALPYPGRAPNRVATQRRDLIQAATEAKRMATQPLNRNQAKPARLRWVWPAVFASGLAAAFLCVLLVAGLAGASFLWRSSQAPSVAGNPNPSASQPAPTSVVVAEAPNAQSGVLTNVRGLVEVQDASGKWTQAGAGQVVSAAQRVRTSALSSATLTFYDGSQARLGPNAEVSIDQLDAQKSGPRVIVMTQVTGESDHDVAHSDDPNSQYAVNTPSGTGTAKGTSFHVLVTAVLVRFDVTQGAVAVTNLNVTVLVVAGQSSLIDFGQPPQEPIFRFTGEGTVTQIGESWVIAGQTIRTNANTEIIGSPRVGDWVFVEGRILADGTRLADHIILLRRAPENQFNFIGTVEAIGETQWTISGRVVHVDEQTTIEAGIQISDTVEASGGIAQDGTLWASSIRRVVTNGFQ
ncbi:MAG: DUF5666 domain-containing protein, partial [Anaerolineales bacterium]